MKYIPFSPAYADAVIALWNSELARDFPLSKRLFQQNTNTELLLRAGAWLAFDEGERELAGFVTTKVDAELAVPTGYIQSLLVSKHKRNQGIGRHLLSLAEDALYETGAQVIHLGKDDGHYFPGIPDVYPEVSRWFEKRGYERTGQVWDMNKSATSGESELPNDSDSPRDLELRWLEQEETDALLTFLEQHFPGRWHRKAQQYLQLERGYRDWIVACKGGEIVGCCKTNQWGSPLLSQGMYWTSLLEGNSAAIGPLGIHTDLRGYGYGQAIVQAAASFLREKGARHLIVDWTTRTKFFGKLGFQLWKSYTLYQKNLSP